MARWPLTCVFGERDRPFLVNVGPDVRLVTDVTGSADELRRGIDTAARPCGMAFGRHRD